MSGETSRADGPVVLGAGAAARALVGALGRALGRRVRVWARDPERARELVREHPALEPVPSLSEALATADLLILAVRDDSVTELARRCAREGQAPPRGAVALHLAGALGPDALAPMKDAGWSTGVFHPLVALPPGLPVGAEARALWRGVTVTLEGEPAALARGRELAVALGADPLEVTTEDARAAYHLAATLAAGGLVTLFDVALTVFRDSTGVDSDRSRSALLALARSSLDALEVRTPEQALTGAVARGDRETLEAHLEAIAARSPEHDGLVRELVRAMTALARRGRRAPEEQLDGLLGLLDRTRKDGGAGASATGVE